MTDKEKAEFIDKTTEEICDWLASENKKIKQAAKEGLEKGLAEGRKELEKENTELKAMFDFVCRQRFGYAWNLNKNVYIEDIKKALKGEKTQWV